MNIAFIISLLLLIIILIYLNHIRTTPYGKMELKSAIALKLIKDYKGDDILFFRKKFAQLNPSYDKKLPLPKVENFKIPTKHKEVPVRLYQNNTAQNLPLVIYIHGGGWCIGSIDTHDQQCRRLAIACGYPVLSIDYSLSPEVKYPEALNEVCDIVTHIHENGIDHSIDQDKIAIIGDSAGGNMVLTSALKLNELGKANCVKCIVPVYPVTNCDLDKGGSFKEFANGYFLTEHLMDLFSRNYIKEGINLRDPYLAPLFSDKLAELPPCFVLTAGLDPLRDEGEALVDKMKKVGGKVKHKRYDNTLHGFFGRAEFGQKGLIANKDASDFLKQNLK